ncbi:MAG TPA: DNA polymerase III subunit gamma/tau [Oscillospiraceae bacterium]|nr:DNA polymerase III subunit gamma/tau [Oscillospiraceae bacterium]
MYRALYRKWRPKSFDDVISQPHITTTLKNQIKNGKTAHAYLFTGSRGTGKTTCARIFAKAVNCLSPKDGEPCLECEICRDAENGALSDIIEMDAASNNGVDDIRDLRENALYTPERCRYKVYIIDEVHMLSNQAFNALLKTLEEPPEFVKFILATTEIAKVPATILSRCQRYDFNRIRTEDIRDRLLYIAQSEGVGLDEDAAQMIASIADGGMRDALSILDQCIAFSENITRDVVFDAAGIAGRDYLFDVLEAVFERDAKRALVTVEGIYSKSKDLQRFCAELLEQMRNLMLIKAAPSEKELIRCLPDERERLAAISNKTSLEEIIAKLDTLKESFERLSYSPSKRIELETALIKLCSGQVRHVQPSIAEEPPLNRNNVKNPPKNEIPAQREEQVDFSKLRAEDFKPLREWADVLEEFSKTSPAVSGTLQNSQAYVNGNVMLINAQNEFFLKLFKIKENAFALGEAVKAVTGKTYVIRARAPQAAKDDTKEAGKLLERAKNGEIPVETN